MSSAVESNTSAWSQPGFFAGRSVVRNLWRLCWQLFRPPRGHRTRPTRTGIVLIGLSLAVGTAAFNTAHNILYLGLSLMLGSLLMSGVMSWLNFAGCRWRLHLDAHGRVGESLPVMVEFRNSKRWLPTYGLSARIEMPEADPLTLHLDHRLGPRGRIQLSGLLQPRRRGVHAVSLAELFSAYPFGFLLKSIVESNQAEVLVWPARADYSVRFGGLACARRPGRARARQGSGTELLNLRDYRPGDPLRMVHWKATARTGRLLVRETAEEGMAQFSLLIETHRAHWDEQAVDRLAAIAASLAEDLFMEGRLAAVHFNGLEKIPVRRLGDLHEVMERFALLAPVDRVGGAASSVAGIFLRFQPNRDEVVILAGEEVIGAG